MLLHENITLFVINRHILEIFHLKVKYTKFIDIYKGVSVMADSDKTLIGDVRLGSNESKPVSPSNISANLGTTHTESQVHQVVANEYAAHKKKPTSFQITSVTVQGSRQSNDGGDDSADDLDESHTEDVSSDILDCSRTTDIDNDQLSEDNSNANNSEIHTVTYPSIPPLFVESNSKNSVTVNVDVPLSVTLEVSQISVNESGSNANVPNDDSSNSVSSSTEPMINPLPDQWQHRFKVVKIVSSEPFKRGRWLCMDFMDPPTVQPAELKQESVDLSSGASTVLTVADGASGPSVRDNLPVNRLAHVYEIPPNESYPGSVSVSVGPQHVQQPLYGIILPVNNNQTPQFTMVHPVGIPAAQAEQILKAENSASQTVQQAANFVSQTSQQQQQAFGGQQSTFPSQQSFPHPPQQSQGLTPAAVQQQPPPQQQQLPIQSTPVPAPPQHQATQPTAPAVSAVESVAATGPQHGAPSTNIVSQPQAVAEAHVPVQQMSQGTQQQSQAFPVHQNSMQSGQLPPHTAAPISTATVINASTPPQPKLTQVASNVPQTQPTQIPQASGMPGTQTTISTQQASTSSNIPECSVVTNSQPVSNLENFTVPSQVLATIENVGLKATSSINPQALLEVLPETLSSKSSVNGEDSESAPGGTSTVAIDNKIEQAMDLVKSHLMFAVREEVDVLKEKITELMDRISQLEYENGFLRANASQETLNQLSQSQQLHQQQQQQQQQQPQQPTQQPQQQPPSQLQSQPAAAASVTLPSIPQQQQQQPPLPPVVTQPPNVPSSQQSAS